ncbi:hypothetical protein Cgig2_011571 [Carnegiea gigantea]|uniref:Uncharacterized protein n=1 Tax=Carnegiea gigantea TaxID=171969 RepID=A0A9Q1GG19_9CARY|nr:hypothetical protein Cgig2_011571 [Carnegiea gigantea]
MAGKGKRGQPRARQGPPECSESPPMSSSAMGILEQEPDGDGIVTGKDCSSQRGLPTYASLVDLDEATTLEFIPAPNINGVICANLEAEDIGVEVIYFQNAVLCCVLGADPPFVNEYTIHKVVLIKKGPYLVGFTNYQHTLQGFYHFDYKAFIVKPWTPKIEINTKAITSLPILVQFPELDIKY